MPLARVRIRLVCGLLYNKLMVSWSTSNEPDRRFVIASFEPAYLSLSRQEVARRVESPKPSCDETARPPFFVTSDSFVVFEETFSHRCTRPPGGRKLLTLGL